MAIKSRMLSQSSSRKFGNRHYKWQGLRRTKEGANSLAKALRGTGDKVRITKTSGGYAVWSRS